VRTEVMCDGLTVKQV